MCIHMYNINTECVQMSDMFLTISKLNDDMRMVWGRGFLFKVQAFQAPIIKVLSEKLPQHDLRWGQHAEAYTCFVPTAATDEERKVKLHREASGPKCFPEAVAPLKGSTQDACHSVMQAPNPNPLTDRV